LRKLKTVFFYTLFGKVSFPKRLFSTLVSLDTSHEANWLLQGFYSFFKETDWELTRVFYQFLRGYRLEVEVLHYQYFLLIETYW